MSVHQSAEVHQTAKVATSATIWHGSVVRQHATIGEDVIVGRNVFIGEGLYIGGQVKIQNSALVYEGSVIEGGVFLGPGVILTNDLRPRAINPDGTRKSADDWELVGVTIRYGAAIGAGTVCVAPVTIGRWALVGAGSVVTRDVPDHALAGGNPARQFGWVGRSGHRLTEIDAGSFKCPSTGERYRLTNTGLRIDSAHG